MKPWKKTKHRRQIGQKSKRENSKWDAVNSTPSQAENSWEFKKEIIVARIEVGMIVFMPISFGICSAFYWLD